MASVTGKTSFAADARHELALQVQPRSCCQLSELIGVVAAARVRDTSSQSLTVTLSSNVAARKVVRLSHVLAEGAAGASAPGAANRRDPGPSAHSPAHFRRGRTPVRPSYQVTIGIGPGTPLRRLGRSATLPTKSCCRRALLRGAFIAAGFVSIGQGGTHLEFGLTDPGGAVAVAAAIEAIGVRPRTRRRASRTTVYVKGSDDVALLLQAMGASQAVLRFENERIVRELRGQANRVANAETGNMGRSVATGLRQATAARRLIDSGLLDDQPLAVRQAADLRLAMPSATLDQLAHRAGLTKSAVNARMRRLVGVAAEAGLVDS